MEQLPATKEQTPVHCTPDSHAVTEHTRQEPARDGSFLTNRIATIYAGGVCFVLPLILHNGYFDVTETKHRFFLTATLALLVCLIAALFLRPPAYRPLRERVRAIPGALHASDLFLFAFFAVYCVSSLLSAFPLDALTGRYNRYQGWIAIVSYALAFCCVTRCRVNVRIPAALLTLSASLCALLALLNVCGLDPFRLLVPLTKYDQGRFLSFIGNVNFFASFLSLALPVALCGFCGAKTRLSLTLYAAGFFALCVGMLVSCSESGALALGVCMLAAIPLTMRDPFSARRLPFAFALFFLACGLLSLLPVGRGTPYAISFFFRQLMRPAVAFPLAAVLPVIGLWLLRASDALLLRTYRRFSLLCAAFVLLFIGFVVLVNTLWTKFDLGDAARFLRFGHSWGTDRGKVWTFCASLYRSFTPFQKLFGGGAGCVYFADQAASVFQDAALDSAHNEYLQYLLTSGLLGLLSYVGFLVSVFIRSLPAARSNALIRGFLLGIISYAAQAVVNIAQPASTPLLFLLCALAVSAQDTQMEGSHASDRKNDLGNGN